VRDHSWLTRLMRDKAPCFWYEEGQQGSGIYCTQWNHQNTREYLRSHQTPPHHELGIGSQIYRC
jgi:hypothetical protein